MSEDDETESNKKAELTLNRSGGILVHPRNLLELLPLSIGGGESEGVSRGLRRSGGDRSLSLLLLLLESGEGVPVVLSRLGGCTVGSNGGFLHQEEGMG